jgi:signal recognition particle subunit SRP19
MERRAVVLARARRSQCSLPDRRSPPFLSSRPHQRITIYPAYLNSKLTAAQGRRLPKDKGVWRGGTPGRARTPAQPLSLALKPRHIKNPKHTACDDPSVVELLDIARSQLGLDAVVEGKSYPRDFWQRGRLRVRLADLSGAPANPAIPDKRALMVALAAAAPSHPHYLARKRAEAEAAASWEAAAKQMAAGGGGGGGGGGPRQATAAAASGASGRAAAAAGGRTSSKKKGRK